jgi:hypothetical protein
MKALTLTINKIKANVKVFVDRQTNRQTGKKNYMPPIFRYGSIKTVVERSMKNIV